jgi:hypothetical protein
MVDASIRTRPPIYYFTGFDLAGRYHSRGELDEPLPGRSAPEHQLQTPCNPFHADIYDIGNLVRQEFTKVRLPVASRLCLRN